MGGGDLIVASGGSIDVDGKGYPSGEGAGVGGGGGVQAGGGSYAGIGSVGGAGETGGSGYGPVVNPIALGSSGGEATNCGTGRAGEGGGAIILTITGSATIEGVVSADGLIGDNCWGQGGGSGGTVNLSIAGTLGGMGSITADGGPGALTQSPGSGGGGRIAITDYTVDTSSLTIQTYGGTRVSRRGGAGTIYRRANLIVRNCIR